MAGDWIKIEKATARKREVLMIAGELSIHPDHAFGLCFRFWSWCDDNLSECHARGVTIVLLDQLLGHDGFGTAAVHAGWIIVHDNSLEIPHFDRHLSQSAKTRALTKERKRKQRKKVTPESRPKRDEGHDDSVTETGPEKRREKKNNIDSLSARAGESSEVPPVDLKTAQSIGETMMIPTDVVEAWWNSRDSVGWLRKEQPITRWQSDLKGYHASWQRNEASKAKPNAAERDRKRTGLPKEKITIPML